MGNRLLEVVFPRFCLGCGYVGVYICPTCERLMKRPIKQTCVYCSKPAILGVTHPRCKRKGGIDGHLALYRYGGLYKKILQKVKYHGAFKMLKELLLFPQDHLFHSLLQLRSIYNPTVIGVPLHANRLKERGFNQSDLIIDEYFTKGGWKTDKGLQRKINTPHLASLQDKKERRKAISGAFLYTGDPQSGTVLLVDDVLTTGATVKECAASLKKAGVQTVLAFSLAQG